jgi:hypothetical protein
MNVPVMLEFAHAPLVAEATTREQAVVKIREMLQDRFSKAEVIQVDVPGISQSRDPWLAAVGMFRGHPDVAEVERNLQEYRREVDADADRL